jgi:hypothetical protein
MIEKSKKEEQEPKYHSSWGVAENPNQIPHPQC